MAPDDASVTFSVAEMLARTDTKNDERWGRVERKLDQIASQLAQKADQTHLDRLGQNVADLALNGSQTARAAAAETRELDGRLRAVETSNAVAQALARGRNALIGSVIAAAGSAAALMLALRH